MIIDELNWFLWLDEKAVDSDAWIVRKKLCPPGGAGAFLYGMINLNVD